MTGATRSRLRAGGVWLLPLLSALLISWWVRASDFDLAAQRWIFERGPGDWSLGDHAFWRLLYVGGTLPATIVVFGALGAFVASWMVAKARRWRRPGLFLVLAAIIGPGIVTNGVLKEYWGRPRPREVIEFGGRQEFEPVLSFDRLSEGMSFPCGHATMGFFFFALYFLWRGRRPLWSATAVTVALVMGALVGVARMMQGAHFFSDMIWAAVVCWYTPLVLTKVMDPQRTETDASDRFQKMPAWMKVALPVVGLGMLTAVLLATPYEDSRVLTMESPLATGQPLLLRIELKEGRVEVGPGDSLKITGRANGHGLPTSNLSRYLYEEPLRSGEEGIHVTYVERISGWFKELNADLQIEVPWPQLEGLRVYTGDAEVEVTLPEAALGNRIHLLEGQGPVHIKAGKVPVSVLPLNDPRVSGEGWQPAPPGTASLQIRLSPAYAGRVSISATAP